MPIARAARKERMSKHQKKTKNHKTVSSTSKSPGSTLSLCMIVKNEADNLKECLQCFQAAADEIVVVDTGSTDQTPELARAFGARVFHFPWTHNFSAARNFSLQQATGDYVLWVDADDRIDPDELSKIRRLKPHLRKKPWNAYYFIVSDNAADLGTIVFLQLRLFPRIPAARFDGKIHEQITGSLQQAGIPCLRTDILLRHVGNRDQAHLMEKSQRNLVILQEALLADAKNPVLLFHAGRTLANLNQREAAIEHMQKILAFPECRIRYPRLALEAGLLQARYYAEMSRHAFSERILRDLLEAFPQEDILHFFLGEAYLKNEHYPEAAAELEKALSIPLQTQVTPLNLVRMSFQRYFYLGLAYQETGRIPQAKEMYIKSLAEHGEKYLSLQALGVLCLKSGEFQEAIRYFEQVIEAGNDSDGTYSNLGLAYRKLKQYSKAERAFLKAIGINGQRVETLANLGHLYWEQKDYARAANCFSQAWELNPTLLDAALALSELYYRFQDLDNLVKICGSLLQQLHLPATPTLDGYSDLAGLYEMIGDTLLLEGRRDLAELAFRAGLQIFPQAGNLSKYLDPAVFPGALPAKLAVIQESLQNHALDGINLKELKTVLELRVADPVPY